MSGTARFKDFVQAFTRMVEATGNDEKRVFVDGRTLLSELITRDDWLPEAFARPSAERYQQFLLYCDPLERFSVVSFVWGPGQRTPVHDHTVWGMVGMMRGAETCEEFALDESGRLSAEGAHRIEPGEIDLVSPTVGDIHRVSNALADRASVSIHVYGGNIGAISRSVYEPPSGRKPFVSGYTGAVMPNIWGP
jgi:predicted metal-dependent enzyme (double-stranded beta helix superfamily)